MIKQAIIKQFRSHFSSIIANYFQAVRNLTKISVCNAAFFNYFKFDLHDHRHCASQKGLSASMAEIETLLQSCSCMPYKRLQCWNETKSLFCNFFFFFRDTFSDLTRFPFSDSHRRIEGFLGRFLIMSPHTCCERNAGSCGFVFTAASMKVAKFTGITSDQTDLSENLSQFGHTND